MANRFGNDYLVSLFAETGGSGVYGAYAGTYATKDAVLPDTIEMKPVRETIRIGAKTGTREPRGSEFLAGRQSGVITLKGELSHSHLILLKALFSRGDSPFSVQNGRTPYSYEIHQHFSGDNKGHVAKGCVLESLTLSGESNEAIQYEATFRARQIDSEVALTTGSYAQNTTPAVPGVVPFLFGNVSTGGLLGSSFQDLNSFKLTLTNLFAPDDSLYQSAFLKLREVLTGFEGNLSLETIYSDATGWKEDAMMSSSVTDAASSITLSDGTHTWTVETNGKITEVKPADPDRQIFLFSGTVQLMGNGTAPAIRFTVA